MTLVQTGDRDAYGQLFARYQAPIWSFLVRRTSDRDASADLFQEVFLRVWRSAHTWDRRQPLRPWLYRVAANLCRDRFRGQQRQVDTVELDPERSPHVHRDDPISPIDLERALAKIPDHLREAFVLGAVEGLDHNELAVVLGISPANARARISRARTALREILAKEAAG